jgi:hypothetical protein
MPRTYQRSFLLAMSAFGLWSCSIQDDGLRRELERTGGTASSSGRPAVILPEEGTGAGAAPPPGIDTPPAGAGPTPAARPLADAAVDATSGSASPADAGPALAALGQSCTIAAACASGFCVDGVCCASACAGICAFCAAEGTAGQCTPVAGAPRGGRPTCMGLRAPCAGACDGQDGSRCQYPGPETECVAPTCTAGVARTRGTCTGTGLCSKRLQVECLGGACGPDRCANGCSPQQPCPATQYCAGGRCFTLQPAGMACAHPEQCQSGACLDGFCCQRTACGPCEACTGPAGTCTRISAGVDPDSCTDGRACTPQGCK